MSASEESAPSALTEKQLRCYAPAAVFHDKDSVTDPKKREAREKREAAAAEARAAASGGRAPAQKRPRIVRKTAPRPCSLAFSRDASLLFSAQSDNSLLVFNAQTSKLVNNFRQLREGVALVQVRRRAACQRPKSRRISIEGFPPSSGPVSHPARARVCSGFFFFF